MNSFKMAAKNIKKSSKDYSVYFLTLIIGVAIFYMFNSVGSQSFMATIVDSKSEALNKLVSVIEFISVGVAFVLGLLMVYANNLIIKRRKKEFGIYLMLGMNIKKVARILSLETLIVGAISLVAGLAAGVLGSQFLSIIVGKMFEADLSAYTFSFSLNVLIKTAAYFIIIFVVVLLFNTKAIKKYNLIDLINAKKSAEKRFIKNTGVSVAVFVISLICLAFAYYEIGFNGKNQSEGEFAAAIIIGFLGNFLFFFSVAGFLPQVLKKFRKFYYNKTNSFVITSFSHNLNSSALAFSMIAIMLFLAISAFSVGFSMNGYLNNRMKNSTPVDASAENLGGRVSELFLKNGIDINEVMDEYVEMPVYKSKYVLLRSTIELVMEEAKNTFPMAEWDAPDNVVRLSDYNKLEDIYGREHISLDSNQYAIICDFDILTDINNKAIKLGNTLTIGDHELTSGYDGCIEEFVIMSGASAAMGVVVLPDEIIDAYISDFNETGSVLAGNYRDLDYEYGDTAFAKMFATIGEDAPVAQYSTKTQITENNVGTSVSVVFIVLYIGIVFIITSAAIIALKILSDSLDAVEKYEILMRIGADGKMCNNALFFQTLLNFLLPFLMGLSHSLIALRYAQGVLKAIGMNRMFGGTSIAVLVMLIVYGGYFFLTYEGCKKNVVSNKI